jgi:DNA-binding MurR/RpiR family transcriptional regulator
VVHFPPVGIARDAGDETLTDIARSYNVSHSTISRLR